LQSRWNLTVARLKGRSGLFAIGIVAAILLLLWGGSRLLASDPEPEYQTMAVSRGDIEDTIGSLGTLEPKDYVDVGTQVSGQLERLYVDIGDEVEQGQLLAEIDPAVYESRVRSSRATLDNLRAQLALQESEQILAQRRLTRNRNLFAENAVSEDVLLASETEVAANVSRIQAVKAQIDSSEATLDGDVANLGYTKIYAPISGTVVNASAIQGQTINSSQTAPTIVRIAKLDVMTVRAQVSEADVVRIQEGMPVYFTTLGMPERRWRATVRKVLPTPEVLNNVVLFHVLIDVDNKDRALMTSMTAQVFFLLAEARDVLVVPADAVSVQRGGPGEALQQVQVVSATGVEWRPVRVGVRSRTEVEIISGLEEGQQIVTGRMTATAAAANSRGLFSMGGHGGGRR